VGKYGLRSVYAHNVNVSFGGTQHMGTQATFLLSADLTKCMLLKAYEQLGRLNYEQTFRSGFNIPKGNYRFSSPCQIAVPTEEACNLYQEPPS
jgi:hypothetical protein